MEKFQCPTTGFLLFYDNDVFMNERDVISFNALPRAFFFSTILSEVEEERVEMFQCPTTGFLLFYRKLGFDCNNTRTCFNALPRAFFFSTLCRKERNDMSKENVSMPYHGLSSFLPKHNASLTMRSSVSMPYHGLSSFLRSRRLYTHFNCCRFQCPTTGFLLFYYKRTNLS